METKFPILRQRLGAYLRFVKIEHTLFSLPLIYAGAFMAGHGWPGWRLSLLILVAAVGGRTLALALNRMIDRGIDRKNPRTKSRELASGALQLMDAALVAVASLLLYVWAAQQISDFCLSWCWAPVLLFLIYPTLKRFTWLSHFGLGLTWSMAPMAGWFAVTPGFEGSAPAFTLGVFSFFWLSGFDIIYSTLDEDFDREEGLYSLPARLGKKGALRVSAVCHVAAFLSLLVLYGTSLGGVPAAFLMIMIGFLLFLEHMLANNVQLAFFKINVIAGVAVFAMVLLGVRAQF